jgi:hypothetical protein
LLTRLIANLDRVASAERSPHASILETGKRTGPSVGRLIEAEPKSIKKRSRFAPPRPSGRRREPR